LECGPLLPHYPDAETRQVIVLCLVHPGHLGGFAAHQGTAGQLAAAAYAFHHVHRCVHIQRAGSVVVEEKQRLGAGDHQVVDAHGNQVDTYGVVFAQVHRQAQFGADPVGAGHQHGLLVARWNFTQGPEAPQATQHLWSRGASGYALDAFHQRVACVYIDPGILVAEGGLPAVVTHGCAIRCVGSGSFCEARHFSSPILLTHFEFAACSHKFDFIPVAAFVVGQLLLPRAASAATMPVFHGAKGKRVKKLITVLLWPLLLLAAISPRGEVVGDLYRAQVPVADQGAGALAAASREALAEVLVKVSGSQDVLANPVVVSALGQARKNVLRYAYIRSAVSESGLEAQVQFDDSYVGDLIVRAGVPLWTVWLVMEDSSGRHFVNSDTSPELAAQVKAEFSRRGVPVQLPLFDLVDTAALSLDQAWRLYGPALEAASQRYDVQDIIAGRLVALSDGNATGDWSYLYASDRLDRSVTAADPVEFISQGVALVAEDMSARYAVAPSISDGSGISMMVQGVSRYADYANIVAWLQGLELIEHANVERVSGSTIELRLQAQAAPAQLAAIIELNQRLTPVPPPGMNIQLSYLWQD
jgi:hypothetical protein